MARIIRAFPLLTVVLATAACGFLVAPTTALAKKTTSGYAPPGNSGVSQYTEDIPTAGGSKPSSGVVVASSGGSGGSGGSGSASSSSISSSVTKALDAKGKAGKAAAALAQATGADSRTRAAKTKDKVSTSAVSQVIKTLGGSSGSGGGLGALLPVILIGSLVVISGLGILRRRGTV